MTSIHGWRLASGLPSQTPATTRWVGRPPHPELTSERPRSHGGLGLVLAVGLSAALWAAVIGAAVVLLR